MIPALIGFLLTISGDMTLSIDNTPHDWSRLAMMLTPGSCAAFVLPHDVSVEEPNELHGYQTHRVKVCKDGNGWGIVEITPFYLRGTGVVLWYGNWHS